MNDTSLCTSKYVFSERYMHDAIAYRDWAMFYGEHPAAFNPQIFSQAELHLTISNVKNYVNTSKSQDLPRLLFLAAGQVTAKLRHIYVPSYLRYTHKSA